jgi:predicted ATP-dependent protease
LLDHDIITAVKEDQFHIYPVRTIETGIEILTGLRAEKKRSGG